MSSEKAGLYIVSGPSGAGAVDVAASVIDSREDITTVLPVSSRKMRAGDVNGKGIWFFDLEEWAALKEAGNLLEQTTFAGNDYGTSRILVDEQLEKGKNVVLSLEIERAQQVKANFPGAVCIYIEPSETVLQQRYEAVARSRFEVPVRMDEARRQRELADFCDCFINSDDIKAAAEQLSAIIK